MEYKNEFDLEKKIKSWKESLYRNSNLSNDTINELESHLIDEIDNLQEKDVNEEEAFFIAKKRLGNVELLAEEFNKVDKKTSFKKNILFYLNGVFLLLIFRNIIYFFHLGAVIITYNLGIDFGYRIPFKTILLSLLSITLFSTVLQRYKRGKTSLNILKNTPKIFIALIITLVGYSFVTYKFIKIFKYNTNYYHNNFLVVKHSTLIYEYTFIAIIILSTCFVFFNLKKNKRNKVADKYYKVI